MRLQVATGDQVEALVMVEHEPGCWECRCGASLGGWWGETPPARWELICEECLTDLYEALNPALADDEAALGVFVRDVERRLGRVWYVR